MKKRILVAVAVLTILALVAIGASAMDGNLVANGDFETPLAPQGGWNIFATGTSGLGWIVEWVDASPCVAGTPGYSAPQLELHRGVNGWLSKDGSQHAELDTDCDGPASDTNPERTPVRIYQDLPTCAGGEYEIKYYWSPRPNHGDSGLTVKWDGAIIGTHSAGNATSQTIWGNVALTKTASGTTTRLEFVETGTTADSLGMFLDAVSVVEISCVLEVDIDIKPGSYPNCFNINGNGVIPVAILGSADFDVTQIDVSTLKFGGLDVRVKGNGTPQCSVEDVSGDFTSPEGSPDGYDDLVCQFVDDPATWSPDDGTATLTGELYNDTPITGTDEICLRPELAPIPILVVSSVALNFSQTGWGGWSCPPDHPNAIDGGVSKTNAEPFEGPDDPVYQVLAVPGATLDGYTFPVFPHYTYGSWYAGETGWAVHNGGTAQSLYVYVYCVE